MRINSIEEGSGLKIHLHLSAEQIGKRAAAVRHVKHVDAGHQLGQFGRDMGRGPVARRGDVEFAGIGFGIGDELRDGLGRDPTD